MPRIPQYVAQEGIPVPLAPRLNPNIAQPVPTGLAAAGSALANISADAQRTALGVARWEDAQARVDQTLKNEEVALDHVSKAGDWELSMQSRQQQLLDAGTPAERIPDAMESFGRERMQSLTEALRYPDSATQFQKKMQPLMDKYLIESRDRATKTRYAQVTAQASSQLVEDSNEAVFGATEGDRAAAFERGERRINTMVERGLWSGEQGAAKRTQFRSDISEGMVRRDFNDPRQTIATIDSLRKGEWKAIAPDRQLRLANELMDKHDSETKKAEQAAKETWETMRAEGRRELMIEAEERTLTWDKLKDHARYWRLSDTEVERLKAAMERPARERPSDEDVLARVRRDTHSLYPQMTEPQLARLYDDFRAGKPGLNLADYTKEQDRLRETRERLIDKAKTDRRDRHGQAEQELHKELGITTPMTAVTGDVSKALAWGLAELRRRSNFFDGTEDPIKAKDDIVPRLQGMLGSGVRMSLDKLRGYITTQGYQSKEEVEAAYRDKRINQGQRNNLLKGFMEIRDQEAELQRLNQSVPAQPQSGKPTSGRSTPAKPRREGEVTP